MFGYDWPRLHAALNDLPAALLIAAVLFDLLAAATRREGLRIASFWTLMLGTLGAAAAVISGLQAEDHIAHGDAVHQLMETHERLALITAGIFALRADGSDGAILQMVNHGLVVAPIFVIVALLAERTGTEDIREMGGMALRAPVLAALFLIVTLATLAMPGSANFVGEFYILNGLFQAKIVYAFIAISGVAMSAYYALRLYQRTMHNRQPDGALSREIGVRDALVLAPLVLCILGLALYPQLILERTDPTVQQTVAHVTGGEAPQAQLAEAKRPWKRKPQSPHARTERPTTGK